MIGGVELMEMKGAAMRVVNERWNELENELGLGLPLNTLSEVDIANKWRLRALNAEKLLNKPQLTIPKSIADELDGYFKYKNLFEAILRDYSVRSNDVIEELRDYLDFLHSNLELCIIYLAGKDIGVDLVKVGEG